MDKVNHHGLMSKRCVSISAELSTPTQQLAVPRIICYFASTSRPSIHKNAFQYRSYSCRYDTGHIRIPHVVASWRHRDVWVLCRGPTNWRNTPYSGLRIALRLERSHCRNNCSRCCTACQKSDNGPVDENIGCVWRLCRFVLQCAVVFPRIARIRRLRNRGLGYGRSKLVD